MTQRSPVARFFAAALYPAVLLGGCALAASLLGAGLGTALSSAVTLLSTLAVLVAFERAMPYTGAWHPTLRTARIDVVHSLVSSGLASPLVRISSVALAAWLGAELSGLWGASLWPASWPLAAQLALAIVVADLGVYGAHRFMHATNLGWRIHAVHHTPTGLNALAAGRSHPLNAVLTLTCEAFPVVLLGITPEAYTLLLVFKAVNGLLQHANIAMTPGPLSYLLATSDVHRFHHSTDLVESNTNFGNATMVWDHVFGTFHLPHRRPGEGVGIAGTEIPESYRAHLLAPFTLPRYERRT